MNKNLTVALIFKALMQPMVNEVKRGSAQVATAMKGGIAEGAKSWGMFVSGAKRAEQAQRGVQFGWVAIAKAAHDAGVAGKKAADEETAALKKTADAAKAAKQRLQESARQAGELRDVLGQVGGSLQFIRNMALGGLGALGAGLTLVATKGLAAAGALEEVRAGYEATFGSAMAARSMAAQVKAFAATTPLEFMETAASAQLLGNLMVEGVGEQAILRRLRASAAATAALRPAGGLDQAVRAIQEVETGQWQLQQLGPLGLSRPRAEKLGIEFDKNGALVTEGKKAADIIEKYWLGRFGSLFDKAAERWQGMTSNLKDNITFVMQGIGEALFPIVKPLIQELNSVLGGLSDDADFMRTVSEGAEELGSQLRPLVEGGTSWLKKTVDYLKENPQALAEAIRAGVAAAKEMITTAATLTAGLAMLAGIQGVLGLRAAFLGLTAVIGTGPAGWTVAAVLLGLVAIYTLVRSSLNTTETAAEAHARKIGEVRDDYDDLRRKQQDVGLELDKLKEDKLPQGTTAAEEHRKKIQELKEQYDRLQESIRNAADAAASSGLVEVGGQLVPLPSQSVNPGAQSQQPRPGLISNFDRKKGGYISWLQAEALFQRDVSRGLLKPSDPNPYWNNTLKADGTPRSTDGFIPDDPAKKDKKERPHMPGAEMIKKFEGFRGTVYRDPVGYPTVGWGHLLSASENKKWKVGTKLSEAELEALFAADYAQALADVQAAVHVPLNDNQLAALVSLAFNIGGGQLRNSQVVKKLNAGDFVGAGKAFMSWNKAKGRILPGLTRRRSEEMALFNSDIPVDYDTSGRIFEAHGQERAATGGLAARIRRMAGLLARMDFSDLDTQLGLAEALGTTARDERSMELRQQLFGTNQTELGWQASVAGAAGDEKWSAFLQQQMAANEITQALVEGKPADEIRRMVTAFQDSAAQFETTAPEIRAAMIDWAQRFFQYLAAVSQAAALPASERSWVMQGILDGKGGEFESFGNGLDTSAPGSGGRMEKRFDLNTGKMVEKWIPAEGGFHGKFNEQRTGRPDKPEDRVNRAAEGVAMAFNFATQLIQSGGKNLATTIGGLLSQVTGNPIFGAVGGLIDAIRGKRNKPQPVEPAGGSMPVHFAQSLGFGLGGNAASAAIGGRLLLSGAAFAQPVLNLTIRQEPGSIDKLVPEFAGAIRQANFNQNGARGGTRP